jgi:hypothetical protein
LDPIGSAFFPLLATILVSLYHLLYDGVRKFEFPENRNLPYPPNIKRCEYRKITFLLIGVDGKIMTSSYIISFLHKEMKNIV